MFVTEMIQRLKRSGEIEAGDLRYLERIADRWIKIAEETAEGTTLSLGGSFTPFAFAIAKAIFCSRSKRSPARVWAHRLTSCSMSFDT